MSRAPFADRLQVEPTNSAVASARWMAIDGRIRARRRRRTIVRSGLAAFGVFAGLAWLMFGPSTRTPSTPKPGARTPTAQTAPMPERPTIDAPTPAAPTYEASTPQVATASKLPPKRDRKARNAPSAPQAVAPRSPKTPKSLDPRRAPPSKTPPTRRRRRRKTTLTLGGPGEVLRAFEDSRRVEYVHRAGRIDVQLTPDGRRWRFISDFVEVEVIGTRFSIERVGNEIRVSVGKGQVAVRRLDEVPRSIVLTSGARMTFRPKTTEPPWAAVDRLLQERRPNVAVTMLEAIAETTTDSAERGLAYYNLGKVHVEQRNDRAAGRRAFAAALAERGLHPRLRAFAQRRIGRVRTSTAGTR